MTVLIGIAVGRVAVAGGIHQPYYNYRNPGPGQTIGRTFYGIVGMEASHYDVQCCVHTCPGDLSTSM